jgi:hypothetical protein
MKNKYGINLVLLGVMIFLFPSLLFAFQNEPNTFRGIRWGVNIKELHDMKLVEDAGDSKFYVKKNDKMKIGDADIEEVAYGFYKGRFDCVQIKFSNLLNFLRIHETFSQLYGSAYRPNRFMEDYYWLGNNVTIGLEYNEILKKGRAIYSFEPIAEEKRTDSKEKAKKGRGDL